MPIGHSMRSPFPLMYKYLKDHKAAIDADLPPLLHAYAHGGWGDVLEMVPLVFYTRVAI